MISIFGAPTILGVSFCVAAWGCLTYKNVKDKRLSFGIACAFSSIAFAIADYKYIIIFYICKVPEDIRTMWLLLFQILCHCITALILCYNYRYIFKRR